MAKRPEEELFAALRDPGCLRNLAYEPDYFETRRRLREMLDDFLSRTGDPRMTPDGEIFESYPRYSPIRNFPIPPGFGLE